MKAVSVREDMSKDRDKGHPRIHSGSWQVASVEQRIWAVGSGGR